MFNTNPVVAQERLDDAAQRSAPAANHEGCSGKEFVSVRLARFLWLALNRIYRAGCLPEHLLGYTPVDKPVNSG